MILLVADEVSAIVVDLGSHTCKAGYAGEDAPKAVFPSVSASLLILIQMGLQGVGIQGRRKFVIVPGGSRGFGFEEDGGWFEFEEDGGWLSVGFEGLGVVASGFRVGWGRWARVKGGRWGWVRVVGAVDQMEVDVPENPEKNAVSAPDSNSTVKTVESEKEKSKRKFYVGSQSLGFRRDNMEATHSDFIGIAFRECLLIDPKEHPMLLAEPSSNNQQQRERAAELMFEKYKVPALFLAKNAVLTSFASGRATSLVVDCGGGSTTVAPVHDGYVLQKVDLIHFSVVVLIGS
ncbi:Actin-related protein 4 [Bienertia sinuspersici]